MSEEVRNKLKRTEITAERTKEYSRQRLSWFYDLVAEDQVKSLIKAYIESDGLDLDILMNPPSE
jgi:hypothetical protein